MTVLKEPTDNESLRIYQRDRWGRLNGETCVVELSGLPARNLGVPIDHELFRQERIEFIRGKICIYKPRFVAMYGIGARAHYEKIAGIELRPNSVQKVGSTIFAFAKHPVAHGVTNVDWVKLGKKISIQSNSDRPATS